MFGSEEILAFIRRQVGVRTDAADPAGSLQAKVNYIPTVIRNQCYPLRTVLGPIVGGSWSSTEASFSGPSYSGYGTIRFIKFAISGAASSSCQIRVVLTVDGSVLPDFGTAYGSFNTTTSSFVAFLNTNGTVDTSTFPLSRYNNDLRIPFRNGFSCTVYYKAAWSGGSINCSIEYDKAD
jgi:hypothetical protein